MVSLFPDGDGLCRLLDAGAGIGSLSAAFLERWESGDFRFSKVELHAFECDTQLIPHLTETINRAIHSQNFDGRITKGDFIDFAVNSLSGDMFSEQFKPFTHAILNPPYKKLRSDSQHRLALRRVGIETVNLYSGFVALAVALAAKHGQIVAIIPRSFCNGPYYRPFREFILERTAIHQIHLFESRNSAFKDDKVLQENIIIRLERDGQQKAVTISTSTDDSYSDLVRHEYSFDQIVFPDDPERFIHVPTSLDSPGVALSPAVRYTLADLGIKLSTGPVVDFRLKAHLRKTPDSDTVPLLYPSHCRGGTISWPIDNFKKPNAIERNPDTKKWLYPNGFYCVVRRFSSKEEKRRIVASVVEPRVFNGATELGFENHLNLFHDDKQTLSEELARGLTVFLNTTAVDKQFRRFSGHTQVNATDLRLMKYPSRNILIQLGEYAMQNGKLTQDQIDAALERFTS